MYLLQLRYFLSVAHLQHVTHAAKELNISQPTLSNMLIKLEEELGVTLFDRQGRNIVLNQYGQTLYHHGQKILNEFDDIQRELSEMRHQALPYTVSIGVSDSTLRSDWLFDLFEERPDFKLKILQMSRSNILEKLLTGELDFGISFSLDFHPEIASALLIDQPYLLLVAEQHPLAESQQIIATELSKLPYISLPSSHQDRAVDVLGKELHFTPNIIFEGHTEMMEEIMQMGTGVILTCEHNLYLWFESDGQNRKTLEIANLDLRYKIYLSWNKDRYLPCQAQFLKHFIEQYYGLKTP